MLNKFLALQYRVISSILFLIIFFIGGETTAQNVYTAPSYFFTSGDYNSGKSSVAHEVYIPFTLNYKYTLVAGISLLDINNTDWNYQQTSIPVSLGYMSYPWQIRAAYSNIGGEYIYKPLAGYDYTNEGNLYSAEVNYWDVYTNYGLHYAYQKHNGILTIDSLPQQEIHQVNLRYDFVIIPELYLSLRPGVSLLSDDRELYSFAMKLYYYATPALTFRTGGFYGGRAYYFDNDNLTLFNQNETQKYQAFFQAEFYPIINLKLTAGYQTTRFLGYKINYIYGGVTIPFVF